MHTGRHHYMMKRSRTGIPASSLLSPPFSPTTARSISSPMTYLQLEPPVPGHHITGSIPHVHSKPLGPPLAVAGRNKMGRRLGHAGECVPTNLDAVRRPKDDEETQSGVR